MASLRSRSWAAARVASGIVVAGFAACVVRDSAAAPDDPAARGLDAYVELPKYAVDGTTLRVNLRTFGFRSAVESAPLGHVAVDAAWSEGDPTPVSAETDADGVATLALVVPHAQRDEVELAVKLRFGAHARTRTFKVMRSPRHEISLRLAKDDVRPGSEVPAWVRVRDSSTGGPAANTACTVALTEGGVVRQAIALTTDASGAATTRVAIPESEDPMLRWEVRASIDDASGLDAVAVVRQAEEVPARPSIKVTLGDRRLVEGGSTVAVVRVRDAADDPVEEAVVRYAISDKADHTPTDEDWEKARELETDALGVARIPVDVPVVGFAKARAVAVRTVIGGRAYDSYDNLEIVAKAGPTIRVDAEGGYVVPGIRQRLVVSAHDGNGKPIAASFDVRGDGLAEKVTTDAGGRAEIAWQVPLDVGARRSVGPCAGAVAATVRVTAAEGAAKELVDAGPTPVCITVRREIGARVELASPIARAGESLAVSLALADPKAASDKTPVSLTAADLSDPTSALAWIRGTSGALTLPETAGGVFRVTGTVARANDPALTGVAMVLVKPRILPKLAIRIAGGRPTPGGEVDVEAKLTDERGAPLEGSVMGVVFDRTSIEPGVRKATDEMDGIPPGLDTRLALCADAGIEPADCDSVLAGEPSGLALLRASMREGYQPTDIAHDPGASSKREMRETFKLVLKNLEGAVFEATGTPERLRDVLRKGPRGDELNPEVMTLVNGFLDSVAMTPGGEPFTLEDLARIDPQVTYDNVARRVARLKLFNVLSAVRDFRNLSSLDPSEPVLADPNGILRKILGRDDAEGALDTSALGDPWGGSMEFVKAGGGGLPFLTPVPGWQLHVAGPDGKIGTADDLTDPFVRVVKSGTPYAVAMGEDKIVDAKLDLRVADATVDGWRETLYELTGTQFGTIGRGDGVGNGSGRLGGSHRSRPPSLRAGATSVSRPFGSYELSAPVRTDGQGVAHVRLPLGLDETTYRVMVVAMPDEAGPAAAFTDVPTTLPLSVRVDGGERWTVGDEVAVNVKVTNRGDAPVHATVKLTADGAAALAKGEAGSREIDVPKRHAAVVRVRVRATSEGEARLVASVSAGSGGSDTIDHRIEVAPRGRRVGLGRARWVTAAETLPLMKSEAGRTMEGAPTLVLEGSLDDALTGVSSSLEPDRIGSADDALLAAAAYERLSRAFATSHPSEAGRARHKEAQALGRFAALATRSADGGPSASEGLLRRARALATTPETSTVAALASQVEECPKAGASIVDAVSLVEAEPPPKAGGVAACWEAAASNAMQEAAKDEGPLSLARVVLAFADRPHRQRLARDAAATLAHRVFLEPSGEITLVGGASNARAARATVYAALVRATSLGWDGGVSDETLLGWLLVQRAPDGGFGSVGATSAAIAALAGHPESTASRSFAVEALDARGERIGAVETVSLRKTQRLPVDPRAASVRITPDPKNAPGGALARVEQNALLGFTETLSSDALGAPVGAEVKWPTDAVVDHAATLEIRFVSRGALGVSMRVPLPPGATLAEDVRGVKQVEGALLVEGDAHAVGLPLEVPLRFGVAGDLTVADTTVRASADPTVAGIVPAARVRVAER